MFLQKTTCLKALSHIFAENGEKAMRRILMIVFLALAGHVSNGQQLPGIELIMRLEGVDSPEDLDPYDVERLESILNRPLRINHASLSKLKEAGLLSHYQAVSLIDYRSRHGDVLSYSELSAVDGFGADFVERIAPFISLESGSLPGMVESGFRTSHEIAVKAASKTVIGSPATDPAAFSYALKYTLSDAGPFAAGIAFAKSYDGRGLKPETVCGHIRYDLKRGKGKVVAGDFNARFGQGLALWNGMSVGSLATPSAFLKRSSGVSASSSFSGIYALRGVAADVTFGRIRFAPLMAVQHTRKAASLLPAANVSYFGRHGQCGITHYAEFSITSERTSIPDMKTSADFAVCLHGTDLFAECAYDWASGSSAALAGAVFPVAEDMRMAAMIRFYPPGYSPHRSAAARSATKCANEHSVSLSGEAALGGWLDLNGKEGFGSSVRRATCTFSLDAACFPEAKEGEDPRDIQLKANTEWTVMLTKAFRLKSKVSERIRTWGQPFRTEIRTDVTYMSDPWIATVRLDAVCSEGFGFLSYLEGGYKASKMAFYMRQGVFFVDNWDDRIYSYERDAPGSFSVPAHYGRGVWTSFNASWRFARWGRMYARAGLLTYPFMQKKKPGKAELKLQFIFDV